MWCGCGRSGSWWSRCRAVRPGSGLPAWSFLGVVAGLRRRPRPRRRAAVWSARPSCRVRDRIDTRRSDSALRRRAVTAIGVQAGCLGLHAGRSPSRSPIAAKASWSAASSSSTASRSSRDRHAVSRENHGRAPLGDADRHATRPRCAGSSCRTTFKRARGGADRGAATPVKRMGDHRSRRPGRAGAAGTSKPLMVGLDRLRQVRGVARPAPRSPCRPAPRASGGCNVVMDPLNREGPTLSDRPVDRLVVTRAVDGRWPGIRPGTRSHGTDHALEEVAVPAEPTVGERRNNGVISAGAG